MIIIPISTKNHTGDGLLIILEAHDLKRLSTPDPIEIQMADVCRQSGQMLLQPNVMVAYEDEENIPKINTFIAKNDLIGLIKYLQRGRKILPSKPIEIKIEGSKIILPLSPKPEMSPKSESKAEESMTNLKSEEPTV